MHISSCLHPVKVYNKYTQETLYVPCGKCAACANVRAKRWIEKLTNEARCWKYTYSLYLDYNEESIPRFALVGDFLVEQNPRFFDKFTFDELCIPVKDLDFKHDYDRNYFFERCTNHDGIPHASVRDIQLFKKRLNKYIYKHITGKYKNFRSAIVSEYGPTTFRSHYHGMLFFNDDRIAAQIDKAVSECWKVDNRPLGHCTCEPARVSSSAVAGYVAQYLNRPTHLPSFHSHSALSPFFLTSRHPPLGSLFESSEEVRKIFFDSSCERVTGVIRQGQVQIEPVPLSPVFKNRLFPKCPRFSTLSDPCRIELYRCLLDERQEPFENFVEAKFALHYRLGFSYNHSGIVPSCQSKTWLFDFLFDITKGFTNDAPLLSLYRISSRIYWQAKIFGISFNEYVRYIIRFYNKWSLYQLKKFYEFQESFTYSPDELVFAYPDYVDLYNKSVPMWKQEFLSIEQCKEFTFYRAHSEFIFEDSHKRTKRNRYFEKLAFRDPVLLDILNKFENAKKRYETNEAKSDSWSERLRFVPSNRQFDKFRRDYAVSKYSNRARWKV